MIRTSLRTALARIALNCSSRFAPFATAARDRDFRDRCCERSETVLCKAPDKFCTINWAKVLIRTAIAISLVLCDLKNVEFYVSVHRLYLWIERYGIYKLIFPNMLRITICWMPSNNIVAYTLFVRYIGFIFYLDSNTVT